MESNNKHNAAYSSSEVQIRRKSSYPQKEADMQSISYPGLQEITSSTLPKQLASEGSIVITIDNKPFAIMISLADENIQDVLLQVSRFRAQMATQAIRSQSKIDGLNKMNLREINSLIKRTRRKQKRYPDS